MFKLPVGRRASKWVPVTLAALLASAAFMPCAQAAVDLPASGSVTMLTVMHVKPAASDDFLAAMQKNRLHALHEPGNLQFEVFTDAKGPDLTVYVIEGWKDAAAVKQHWKAPTLLALHDAVSRDAVQPPSTSVVSKLGR